MPIDSAVLEALKQWRADTPFSANSELDVRITGENRAAALAFRFCVTALQAAGVAISGRTLYGTAFALGYRPWERRWLSNRS